MHAHQLALQCVAAFIVISLCWPYFGIRNEILPWPGTALAIGVIALLIARITKQPWWWQLIHTIFAPLAWGISELSIAPGWFLLAFILTLLVYRGAITGQIPLFLSNHETASCLIRFIPTQKGICVIDLGAGFGSILYPLAKVRPDANFTGVENAPATWLVGFLRTLGLANCHWRWGDFWHSNLVNYDVVYAFLSPAPMLALWEKASSEMRLGSLFISNSFPVPGIEATQIVDVEDARQTRLYCYQI